MEFAVKWMYSVDGSLVMPYQNKLVSLMNTDEFKDFIGIELYKRYTGLPWLIISRQVDAAIKDGFLEWVEPNQHLRPTLQGRRFLNVLLQRFF